MPATVKVIGTLSLTIKNTLWDGIFVHTLLTLPPFSLIMHNSSLFFLSDKTELNTSQWTQPLPFSTIGVDSCD